MVSNRAADAAQLRTLLAAQPNDRVAWHNLAAAEGDLRRASESEFAARRAIALGIAAPETRLVLARELQSNPERGRLVLFPAYMWHGVEPFESDLPRVSVAFDVVPA